MAFKRKVVEELERGRFGSVSEARRHYGIGGSETIRGWLKRFGKNHLIPKVVRVEKPDEANQIRQLREEIRRLKEALGETQMRNVLSESYLEIACERMGVDIQDFKKKAGTKLSIESDRKKSPR
ncbi:MAG: helix-turn-helix domain-containing protein [Pirellulaceae bacterium]